MTRSKATSSRAFRQRRVCLSASCNRLSTNAAVCHGIFPGQMPSCLSVNKSHHLYQLCRCNFILPVKSEGGGTQPVWQCDVKGHVCFQRVFAAAEDNGFNCSACLEYPPCNKIDYHYTHTKVFIPQAWCGKVASLAYLEDVNVNFA